MTYCVVEWSAADAGASSLKAHFVSVAALSSFDPSVALREEAERVEFRGKVGEAAWVAEGSGRFVAVIGCGERPADARRAGWKAVELCRQLRVEQLVLSLDVLEDDALAFAVEGVELSTWRFGRYKTEEKPVVPRAIYAEASPARRSLAAHGSSRAAGICLARDVSNESPAECTPEWLASRGRARAEHFGMACEVWDELELERRGFNLHLAVGRGSDAPPRMFYACYRGSGEARRRVAIVGKGVTFDSGGYSLKPSSGQIDMHLDMGGAAAVLGTLEVVGREQPAGIEVHFIAPMAENLVSGRAFKVNDVIRSYSGEYVEIHNTDAEGRLLLADALAWSRELKCDEVVDLATLTGACVAGLGMETAGLFANDDALREALRAAAESADELVWPLPLTERMRSQLDSRVADVKNIGGRWGGAITAALFLERFVGEQRWAHLDIAGPAMAESSWEYINAGGTGFGVATLVAWLGLTPPAAKSAANRE